MARQSSDARTGLDEPHSPPLGCDRVGLGTGILKRKPRRSTGLLVLAALAPLAFPAISRTLAAETRATGTEPRLTLGIRQFQDGDFEEAVFTLDSVVGSLQGRPDRRADLVQAYLHLGAAFAGLDHDGAAPGEVPRSPDSWG